MKKILATTAIVMLGTGLHAQDTSFQDQISAELAAQGVTVVNIQSLFGRTRVEATYNGAEMEFVFKNSTEELLRFEFDDEDLEDAPEDVIAFVEEVEAILDEDEDDDEDDEDEEDEDDADEYGDDDEDEDDAEDDDADDEGDEAEDDDAEDDEEEDEDDDADEDDEDEEDEEDEDDDDADEDEDEA